MGSNDPILEAMLNRMVREVMRAWIDTNPRPDWPAIRAELSLERWGPESEE